MDAIYQVSVTKNKETYFRLRREDAAMCEALRELFADEVEQAEREGKRQGKIEGKIEEAILIYQDELSLSPEQTVQKIMTRFGLERKDAEQSVEKVLNSGAVGVSV